jgi:hypothetical protein
MNSARALTETEKIQIMIQKAHSVILPLSIKKGPTKKRKKSTRVPIRESRSLAGETQTKKLMIW